MRTILRRCRGDPDDLELPAAIGDRLQTQHAANGMRHSFSSTVCGTPTPTCSRCLNRRVDLVGPRPRCVEEMRAGETFPDNCAAVQRVAGRSRSTSLMAAVINGSLPSARPSGLTTTSGSNSHRGVPSMA
jgi:hypothetical protein